MHTESNDVAFTDVDYYVMNDGAKCIIYPLDCCTLSENSTINPFMQINNQKFQSSPYNRDTYRYTPLLAYICLLNHMTAFIFNTTEQSMIWIGKLVFISCDMLIAHLMGYMQLEYDTRSNDGFQVNLYALTIAWILNPFVWTISARGNAESVVCVLIISWLFFLNKFKQRSRNNIIHLAFAAIFYGLAVHVKIFPILYIIPFYFWIQNLAGVSILYPSKLFIWFSLISGSTFIIISSIFYTFYGFDFLNETYLYHITRLDHRHNFSLYFYYIYGIMSNNDPLFSLSIFERLSSFLPQLVLLAVIGSRYGKNDLPLSCFLITFMFVSLNKVCTSQYFMWYWMFVPFIRIFSFHESSKNRYTALSIGKIMLIVVIWLISQALWLSFAYKLEFMGEQVFFLLWICGIVFFVVNTWIIGEFCHNTRFIKS